MTVWPEALKGVRLRENGSLLMAVLPEALKGVR